MPKLKLPSGDLVDVVADELAQLTAQFGDRAKALAFLAARHDPDYRRQLERSQWASVLGGTSAQTQAQQPAADHEWRLSPWSTNGQGAWQQQPTLSFRGQQLKYEHPAEYLTSLAGIKTVPGVTGPIDQQIRELERVLPEFGPFQPASDERGEGG